jgi:hypothetical protein
MQRLRGWTGRKDRNAVEIAAVAHRPDGSKLRVTLTNFSEEGCRMEGAEPFRIGEQLRIAVPGLGQLKAQIRWALPGNAGAQFVTDADAF